MRLGKQKTYLLDMQDLLNKGCLSFKVFCEAYNKQDHDFTAQDVGDVGDNQEDPEMKETVMIPCLIKDSMERRIKDAEKKMERSQDSLSDVQV